MTRFTEVAQIAVDPATSRVFEYGWQSWSPSTSYALTERPHRPYQDSFRRTGWRLDVTSPADAFWGEGLLAVRTAEDGPVHVAAVADASSAVPSIRADVRGGSVVVSSDGPVEVTVDDGPGGLEGALARWADRFARAASAPAPRPAPTTWCSWYHYFTDVTQADVEENLDAMDEFELPVDVVQLDDGYEAEIGDWLDLSGRFTSLADLAGRIRDRGRRAGIWVAPFLAAHTSALAAKHPEWLVREADGEPVDAHIGWTGANYALDTTHPGAQEYLREVFTTLHGYGFDFFKLDFVFGGAVDGRRHAEGVTGVEAYREGLRTIRAALGDEPYILGCGAPQLPSVGLVDGMRVGADTAPHYEPGKPDLSIPGQRCAELNARSRAFTHGRFWAADPDCLIVRPEIERREDWAATVEATGGLRSSSDRLRSLDAWGLETTRRVLSEVPTGPIVPS